MKEYTISRKECINAIMNEPLKVSKWFHGRRKDCSVCAVGAILRRTDRTCQLDGDEATMMRDATNEEYIDIHLKDKNYLAALSCFFESILSYPGLSVCFETPHQLTKTLKKLSEIAPDCRITLAREITKRYEEVCKGSPAELLEKFPSPKGEFVLIIKPLEKEQEAYSKEELTKLVKRIETKYELSRKKAAELLQEFKGISKKDVYHA